MGHYVFTNTYSAEIQQRFITANSSRVKCAVEFVITAQYGSIALIISSPSFLVVLACSAETEKVCKLSSEENLQPFKDKMDTFLSQGKSVFLDKLKQMIDKSLNVLIKEL